MMQRLVILDWIPKFEILASISGETRSKSEQSFVWISSRKLAPRESKNETLREVQDPKQQ